MVDMEASDGDLEAEEAAAETNAGQKRRLSDSTLVLLLVLAFSGVVPFFAAVKHVDWDQDAPLSAGDLMTLAASLGFLYFWLTWMAKLWDYLRTPLAEPAECSYEVLEPGWRRYHLPFRLMRDEAQLYLMREGGNEITENDLVLPAGRALVHALRNVSAIDPGIVITGEGMDLEVLLKPAWAKSVEGKASEAWQLVERVLREAAFVQVGAWPRFVRSTIDPEPEPQMIEVPCLQLRGGGFAANPE